MTARKLLHEQTAFAGLQDRANELAQASIPRLFAADSDRAQKFLLDAAGLQLDFSKHLLDDDALSLLLQLAGECKLEDRIASLFAGDKLNNTEDRPALHTLLRATSDNGMAQEYAAIRAAQGRMRALADSLNGGSHTGYTGAPIRDVVNIGIGGSDLGPRLVTEALKPFHRAMRCHYVANVDPSDLQDTLGDLTPATTLFIVCSKSFRTEETLANSLAARAWMLESGASSGDLDQHFVAVTSNLPAAAEFGIGADNCFPMWDWVGGRYSVWSAIGLSCAIAIGWENFNRFLAGAEAMDSHFRNSPLRQNMPMLMSLLELWYCNFLGAGSHVVLPYHHNLRRLPDYLQQLTMESNGKRVSSGGNALDYPTAPILWGSAGTMGQHSFHQLLHQGTSLCPADFILPLRSATGMVEQHSILVANCLAQSRALMVGRSLAESEATLLQRGMGAAEARHLAPHLVMPGNRPSSIIAMEELNPTTLGALLALYEHRTFCSGQLWGINPFDQWGVELGKEIGTEILGRLSGPAGTSQMDAATERLIAGWRHAQQ